MKHSILFVLSLSLATATLHAQAPRESGASAVGTLESLWKPITAYITTAAEEVPESTYAYRPTPDVRTFGQLIGHIAGAVGILGALGHMAYVCYALFVVELADGASRSQMVSVLDDQDWDVYVGGGTVTDGRTVVELMDGAGF